jgi:cell division protein FtsI/penicillin-binding protein 2
VRGMEVRNKRRMFTMLLLIFLLWGTLIGRLFWIQVVDTRSFTSHDVDLVANSVSQRKRELILDTGRGMILDRYGRPFTGKTVYTLVVFPLSQYPFNEEPKVDELAQVVGLHRLFLLNQIAQMKVPTVVNTAEGEPLEITEKEAKQVNELGITGIRAMPYNLRYSENQLARHVIGYIGKNPEYVQNSFQQEIEEGTLTENSIIGVAGLEKSYQPFLQGLGPTIVSYFVNAVGNPLRGLKIRYSQPENPFYPLSIVTTLDYDIQKAVEQVMDEAGIEEGAAVVLDTENADILAMVSRPNFNSTEVDPSEGSWANRAVQQMIPGSIFKTVVAAAALEKGIYRPEDEFFCDGSLGKYQFHCWKEGGHGKLTFEEGFAQSCNIVFAHAAMKLKGSEIEQYGEKFGLFDRVGWSTDQLYKLKSFQQMDGEQTGQLFTDKKHYNDDGVLVQASIGQRDVRVTPLQAANMVVTILQRGQLHQPRLVKQIDYLNGTPFHTFPEQIHEQNEAIQPYTAYLLMQWMRSVVVEGTGQSLKQNGWKLAGKSGTAQVNVGNEERNNQWFIGYGPVESPRYAVAVVAQKQKVWEKKKATIAFGRIMDELAKLGR